LVDTLVFAYPVDDTATMLLKFDSGAHATVSSHWSTLIPDPEESSSLVIYGTKGTIFSATLHDKQSRGYLKVLTKTERTEYHYEESTHAAMLEAFTSSIERGAPVPITGYDGLAASRIIAAAYESAKVGRAIAIP
jgi:predicted dehydrogenase